MADKLTTESQQALVMLTNEHQEQHLTADIQRDTTDDVHVASVTVLQQHGGVKYEAEVLTMRQKTEGPRFRLVVNDMKPEQRTLCQNVMEELEVEKESNTSLREELMKVRASYQEMNRMYEADLDALRRHVNVLQQELEDEKKSHEDTVSRHQLMRTEPEDTCCREFELDVENTAEQKMLLLTEMEKLKSQLDGQLSVKLKISTEFKVEREDEDQREENVESVPDVLLKPGPDSEESDVEIVEVESSEKNHLLPNVLLKQDLESDEETVEVQASEEELELNEQKTKLTDEVQRNQKLTDELETLRRAVANVEASTSKNLKIRELEDAVGAEREKRAAAEATLARQTELAVRLLFALTGAQHSLQESRSQWEQDRSRLLAEHRQETERITAMLRLEEEGRRRRLEWQRDMFAFLESLGINEDSVGHGIGGGGDGWERTGRSSNV